MVKLYKVNGASTGTYPYPYKSAWSDGIVNGFYVVQRTDNKFYINKAPLCSHNDVVSGPFETLEAAELAYILAVGDGDA